MQCQTAEWKEFEALWRRALTSRCPGSAPDPQEPRNGPSKVLAQPAWPLCSSRPRARDPAGVTLATLGQLKSSLACASWVGLEQSPVALGTMGSSGDPQARKQTPSPLPLLLY